MTHSPARPTHQRHASQRRRSLIHLLIDASVAPVTFMVANTQVDARTAALISLGAALVAGCVRRLRGDPLVVVTISTVLVALHSASAFAVGEGRAYFLPEFAINVGGLALCLISLALRKPITAVACRRLGVDPSDPLSIAANLRRHRLLTLAWTVLWIVHLALLVAFYWRDSVPGLTAVSTFDKVTMFAMAALTLALAARPARSGPPATTNPSPYAAANLSATVPQAHTPGRAHGTGSEGIEGVRPARDTSV